MYFSYFQCCFMPRFVDGYFCVPVAGQLKGTGACIGRTCVVL